MLAIVLGTVQGFADANAPLLWGFELFSLGVFSVEYLARLWACPVDPRYRHPIWGRLRFALTPMALVDLIAILPGLLPVFGTTDTRFLRMFRLARMLRILKLGRYSESVRILAKVLLKKKEELAVTLFVLGISLMVASTGMYYLEESAQPETFPNIPAAMWWGIATLTTVGYGDVYPVTVGGKFLAALIATLGIGMFALPAGILGSGFMEEFQRRKEQPRPCPHCGKMLS